jgi:hypothetical protein
MAQTYKSHGSWSRYIPDPMPADKPVGTIFCKRDTDGVDWYDYAHTAGNFTDGSAKLTLMQGPNGLQVAASNTDPSALFPQGCTVLEVIGFEGAASQFAGKIVDPTTDAFSDPPTPPSRTMKADIWRRCTDDEAVTLTNLLASQPLRQRQLYNDANYLSHDDPMYQTLYAAVVQALTQARADAILAPS